VVQRGDTLFRISQRFGVNMWVLAQRNNILNLNRIYAGQTLFIPT
jgi:LysM repeat protein